jgi:hypothetical protein
MRLGLVSGVAVMLLWGGSASAQLVRQEWEKQVDGYRIHPDAEPMPVCNSRKARASRSIASRFRIDRCR